MKTLILLIIAACAVQVAVAQVPTVPTVPDTTQLQNTASVTTTALQWLDTNKGNRYSGSSDPLVSCNTGDSYTQTATHHLWWCVSGSWVDIGFTSGSGNGIWGQITGLLTNQSDLSNALNGKAAVVHGHSQSDVTGLISALSGKESTANRAQPNGYASLDSTGVIPSAQIPPQSGIVWGLISGTISAQPDLVAALAGREPANANIQAHIINTTNPHSTTAAQVGLGSVTNNAQLKIASNLSDLNNVSSARANLGLGGSAVLNVGTIAGTVAAGDHLHTGVYAPFAHTHTTADVTSGVFNPARLGTSGTGSGTLVLYDDGVFRAPPGSSGGEANTASNNGTVGVGLFKSKAGVDLQFYKLNALSSKLTIALNGTDRVDVDVIPSAIDHQTLLGAGANTHAQIDSHISNVSNPHNVTAAQAGAVALTLMTTLGDLPYRDGTGWQRLAGSILSTRRLLCQTGTGTVSAAPTWCALVAGDIPDLTATYPPVTRTVNTHPLSADVTVTKGDVGLGNVDNTADTAKPVSTAQQTALDLKANLAGPTFTGTVGGITKSMVGLGSVDNTADTAKPVSTAQQTALDLKAPLATPAFTGTPTAPTAAPGTNTTQLATGAYVEAGLALKANLASPTFTGTVAGITKSMVGLGSVDNTADTAKPVSTAQQTALDLKANLASPTFTGTVAGITATMVGLSNVNNTSDAAKPVSTAQQTALNLKANIASPTFTGVVTVTPTGGVAGNASFSQGTVATPAANTVGFQAPTSVPSAYAITLPGAPAAGFVKRTNTTPSVETVGAINNSELPTTLLSGVLKYIAGTPIQIGTSSTNCVHEDGSSGACATGGLGPVYTTVTFSATPTFTVAASTIQTFTLTLTGDVTSSTLATAGATVGQSITLNICQDGTGSHAFVPPSNVTGMGTIVGTASTCSRQDFRWDGTNAIAITSLTCPACASSIVLPGSTSGTTTIVATAAASGTVTLPAATDTLMGKATTDTQTNKTIDAEATGNLITIPIKVYLAAATCQGASGTINWDTTATLNPTATCSAGTTATTMMRGTADFPDLDGSYNLQVEFPLAADWTGAVDMKVFWRSAATTGDVIWQVGTACVANGAVDDVAFNTTQNFAASTAKATTLQVNTVSLTGLTMTGCAAGSLLHLKLMRDRTTAADTIAGVVSLIGAELTMRRGM